MLKHIKPKDILEFLLFGALIVLLLFVCSIVTAPLPVLLWTLLPLAAVLWVIWFIVVVYERNKRAKAPGLKIFRNGEWIDVQTGEAFQPTRRQAQFYDQDNDPHDTNTKEYQA